MVFSDNRSAFLVRQLIACLMMLSFLVGCEKQPAAPVAKVQNELTASDLARLMDFHAWTLRIPEKQQPVKSLRMVIAKHDRTFLEQVFSTGDNLQPGQSWPEPYSSILLGFRVERETFTGHLFVGNSQGAGKGWNILFTNAFADVATGWVADGPLHWTGDRAELGMSTRSNGFDTIMAIEMVK
jgi:hypothetical protein